MLPAHRDRSVHRERASVPSQQDAKLGCSYKDKKILCTCPLSLVSWSSTLSVVIRAGSFSRRAKMTRSLCGYHDLYDSASFKCFLGAKIVNSRKHKFRKIVTWPYFCSSVTTSLRRSASGPPSAGSDWKSSAPFPAWSSLVRSSSELLWKVIDWLLSKSRGTCSQC